MHLEIFLSALVNLFWTRKYTIMAAQDWTLYDSTITRNIMPVYRRIEMSSAWQQTVNLRVNLSYYADAKQFALQIGTNLFFFSRSFYLLLNEKVFLIQYKCCNETRFLRCSSLEFSGFTVIAWISWHYLLTRLGEVFHEEIFLVM